MDLRVPYSKKSGERKIQVYLIIKVSVVWACSNPLGIQEFYLQYRVLFRKIATMKIFSVYFNSLNWLTSRLGLVALLVPNRIGKSIKMGLFLLHMHVKAFFGGGEVSVCSNCFC